MGLMWSVISKVPQSKKILKAQDGEDKGEYKLNYGPPPGVRDHRERGPRERGQRPIQRWKVFGLRLHDLAENFELEEGLHEGSHRHEHSEKEHEGHRPAIYKK